MSKYDIIIAGSGLGGLECAAILSKEGYNVCVLEKNPLFGGCLQTYTRQRHMFDTGIHYIGSLDEGQIMHQYFKYFGIIDKLNMCRLDENSFDRIFFKENVYDYANSHENFADKLAAHFPKERDNLKNYASKLQTVGSLINVDNLKKGSIAQNGMDFFYTSASGYLNEHFEDNDLKNILAGTSMLYAGMKDYSTFYHHAMINNSYIESAYRFVDGTMQIAEKLIEVIKKNGGSVINNKGITRFIVDENDKKVTAVEVNNEEIIEADQFISNIHPKRTLELLDKTRHIKKAYISRVNALPNSFGVFTLYLIMKKDTERYQNRNFYVYGRNVTDAWYDPKKTFEIHYAMICHQCNENSAYSDVLTILCPVEISEFKKWEDTTIGNRGQDYEAMKEAYSMKIIDFLKERGFDYTSKIESMYSTTPLSYRDYTATPDGSAYGIIKDYRFPELSFISTKTKLNNLHFTGQNMNVHGALGVTLTAMFTCSELVGQEYLCKKVGNA